MKYALPNPFCRSKSTAAARVACVAASFMLGLVADAGTAKGIDGQGVFIAHSAAARALLLKMTLEEKVGQMMQVEQAKLIDPLDVATYHLGSLLSGGGSGPKRREDYTRAGWAAMVAGYQKTAMSTRLAIPLLYGIDAVHGNNNIPGATIYPHNIGLGATRDPALVRKIARATAEEVRAIGVNWSFAPCVTVPQDVRWGRTYEGFSQDPSLVKRFATEAVKGFQTNDLAGDDSILACAKHFIGDGGTTFGSTSRNGRQGLDQGDTRIDEATLRRLHLPGYLGAIPAGVGSIMPSYSSWNGVKCSASRYLLTDLLKHELHFEGIVISDYDAVDQIDRDYKRSIEVSINAGMDMVMMTGQYRTFFKDLVDLVNEGKVPMSRIDDAVLRILRVKSAMGLLKANPDVGAVPKYGATFGGKSHRDLARQAVRESMVLLKNERATLPLPRNVERIHVAGRGADNLGMQCGGWTTSWQGSLNNSVPGATTILSAIKAEASSGTSVTYSADGQGAEGATVGVVVVGERPYAEFQGDRADMSLPMEEMKTIANMKKAKIPIVVVLLSGRPVVLGDALTQADALVAAWLPGSEGAGVADVLFGAYRPTGKLPGSWPKSTEQLPLALKAADALFPFGFGQTYSKVP